MLTKKYTIGLIAIVLVTGVYAASVMQNRDTEKVHLAEQNGTVPVEITTNSPEIATQDQSNEAEVATLVSHAELPEYINSPKGLLQNEPLLYLFLAQVIEKTGQVQKTSGITTQYTVRVLKTINNKTMPSTATLNQSGVGYVQSGKYAGMLAVRDGDIGRFATEDGRIKPSEVFLKSGGLYLFAALSLEGKEFTISASPYDRALITGDAVLSDAAALDQSRQNPTVRSYVDAARELGVLNPQWNTD